MREDISKRERERREEKIEVAECTLTEYIIRKLNSGHQEIFSNFLDDQKPPEFILSHS